MVVDPDCSVLRVQNVAKPTLLGIGHPLLDISVNVSKDLLTKYDLKANDGILGQSKHESIVDLLFAEYRTNLRLLAGGSVLNTMRFAQWVFEGNHESIVGQAQFFGSIGSDDFGQLLIRQTISDRVEPLFVPVSNPSNASARCKPVLETQDSGFHDIDDTVDDDEKQSKNDITTDNTDSITGKNSNSTPDPTKSDTYHNQDWQTGVCVALNTHNGANRSMIAFLGAARALASNHVQDHLEHIRQANAIYTSGFLLGSSAEAVWKLVELRCPGQLIAFNLSATYVCHAFGDLLWRLLPHLDIVFCNSEELKAFAEFNKWKETDCSKIALQLFEQLNHRHKESGKTRHSSSMQLVVTQDELPVLVFEASKPSAYKSFQVPTLEANKLIDTIGAGDAFVGGYLAQRLLNRPLSECVRSGIYCARQVIQMSGCQLSGRFELQSLNSLFDQNEPDTIDPK